MAQVVEHLPSKHQDLMVNLSTSKREKREKLCFISDNLHCSHVSEFYRMWEELQTRADPLRIQQII
jgi:hypothetical protein